MKEETPDQIAQRYDAKARLVAIVAAHMAGELSEGQASKLIDEPCLELRIIADEYKAVAKWMWERYRTTGETLVHDIASYQPRRYCERCGD